MLPMVTPIEQLHSESADWQGLCQQLRQAPSLARLVIVGRQMGVWLGREIVEQEMNERAQIPTQWGSCCSCGSRLVSQGFVGRQQQTLLGKIEWGTSSV